MDYLNEEQYNKSNKKVKVIGIIIILIGLCLIAGGIFNIIESSKIQVPKMEEEGWFESSSSQMQKKALGMFMIIPGTFLSIVGCMVRFGIGNRREILSYQIQQERPIAQEGIEKMSPTIGVAAKEIAKGVKEGLSEDNEVKYCKYCGKPIDKDSKFCKECGKEQ